MISIALFPGVSTGCPRNIAMGILQEFFQRFHSSFFQEFSLLLFADINLMITLESLLNISLKIDSNCFPLIYSKLIFLEFLKGFIYP